MSRIKTILTIGLLQTTILISGQSFAGPVLDQIKADGVFKIGTEGTYAPFTYHDKDNKLVGFDVELGEAIAKELGVKAQFLEGKWDGLIAGLDVKRYDAVINQVGITDARKQKYSFSEPYSISKAVLIVKDGNPDIKSFDDLKGKKSAQAISSNFGKIASSYGADIVANDGFDQSIQLVLNGQADATINDSLSFYDFQTHKPDSGLVVIDEQKEADYTAVLMRQDDEDLVAAVNKALEAIKADGTYKTISEKYFGKDISQ